jgi:hypothetical protein
MEPEQLFEQRISQLRRQSNRYQVKIAKDMNELNQLTDTSRMWANIKQKSALLLRDRRTLYVAGGIILSFVILRFMLGQRTSVIRIASKTGNALNKSQSLIVPRKRGLLMEVVQMAIQTIILHYVRKLLKEVLDQREKKPSAAAST